ncbi:MAG: nucleoside phosphorylase [Bacteroidales bacterium]|nr:nucleoside phosphorylase [Bacteroidales bacterium]
MPSEKKIPASELILNSDGSIYHLNLKPEHLAGTIILVGDPARVDLVSGYFDKIEFKGQNREIHTQTGIISNMRLTVMSTGMGTDNIDIVLNELDALVNIDLKTRTIKPKHTSLNIIRMGTSGAIQQDIPVNSIVMSEFGLGLDGLLNFYKFKESPEENAIAKAFVEYAQWNNRLSYPYIVAASSALANALGKDLIKGITATAPGFYGPQGRVLRLQVANPGLNEKLKKFRYQNKRIVNFEMETSALYGLGRLLGHKTLTVCCAIANRESNNYNQNYHSAIIDMIELMLGRITQSKFEDF